MPSSTQTSESSEEVLECKCLQYVESPRIIKEKRRQVWTVKSPKQRLDLVENLKLGRRFDHPVVWIPKAGTDEKRPLGIPTMNDRAQALVKLVLEPEWKHSLNLTHTGLTRTSNPWCVWSIFNAIRYAKYVLDADIAKCFDRIDHEALLNKLKHPQQYVAK